MAYATWCVLLNDEKVNERLEKRGNDKTQNKTQNYYARGTADINKKINLAVRKKNSEDYKPLSIRAFIQSIDWHLRTNSYAVLRT